MNEDKARELGQIAGALKAELLSATEKLDDLTKVIAQEVFTSEPVERICGLTMEEWQVVIDGRYFCEFGSTIAERGIKSALASCNFDDPDGKPFYREMFCRFEECRVWRAVGHVQPYFDNDECREYLDGLALSAKVITHSRDQDYWLSPRNKDGMGSVWGGIDKFIVLSNE